MIPLTFISGGNSQWSIGWDQGNDFQQQYKDQVQTYQSSYQKNSYDGYYGNVPSENLGSAGAPTRVIDHKHHTKAQVVSPTKNEGYGQDERTSVRVHAPPGGKSNFSIGNAFNDNYSNDVPQSYGKQSALSQHDMNQKKAKQNSQFHQSSDIFGTGGNSYQQQDRGYGGGKQKQYAGGNKSQGRQGGYQQQDKWGGPSQNNWEEEPQYPSSYGKKPQQKGGYQNNYQQQQPYQRDSEEVFGQRVTSGNNNGPETGKSSVKLHAPPGGKTSIQLF